MWCGNNGTIHEGTLFVSDCLSLFQFRHIKQVIFFTIIIIAYTLHCILQVVVMLCYVMLCYAMLCCLLLFWFHFWHNRLFFSQAKYKIIIMFKSNNINKEFCNKRKEFRRTSNLITKHLTKHDKTLWYNL